MSPMRTLILWALVSVSAFAQQAELNLIAQETKAVSIKATSQPQVYGNTVIADGLESATVVAAAKVTVEHNMKFVDVTARKTVQEFGNLEPLSQAPGVQVFILTGAPGDYVVEAIGFDPDLGIVRRTVVVKIAGSPFPVPPTPDPSPGPGPGPGPVPPVPNDYNVGAVVRQYRPADPGLSKQIAGWYRQGADRLYGIGGSGVGDILSLGAEIDKKFASKQCVSQEICQQWGVWQQELRRAMIAEQARRGYFTREDWYKAFNEIAAALEAQ